MLEVVLSDPNSAWVGIPLLFEFFKQPAGLSDIRCPVNALQFPHEFQLVFPRQVPQGVADEVGNAALDDGLREDGPCAFFQATDAIHADETDVCNTAALNFVEDLHPRVLAFGLVDPDAQDIFVAVYGIA